MAEFFTDDEALAAIAATYKNGLPVRDEKAIREKLKMPQVMEACKETVLPEVRKTIARERGNDNKVVHTIDSFDKLTADQQIEFVLPGIQDIIITDEAIEFVGRNYTNAESENLAKQILRLDDQELAVIRTMLRYMQSK